MNDPIYPCVFIKNWKTRFAMIAVYVNNTNLIKTLVELSKTAKYFKKEFKIKI